MVAPADPSDPVSPPLDPLPESGGVEVVAGSAGGVVVAGAGLVVGSGVLEVTGAAEVVSGVDEGVVVVSVPLAACRRTTDIESPASPYPTGPKPNLSVS